jgi:plastocyanin
MGRLLAAGLVVVAALVAVLVVNGEGPNKPEDAAAGVPARQSGTVSNPSPAAADTGSNGEPVGATVKMRHLKFVPTEVSVDVGEAVRFVNDDDVAHTILQDFGPRSGEIAAVDSDRILPGETFTFVPRAEGLISFVCTLHPAVMSGQILVEQPAT